MIQFSYTCIVLLISVLWILTRFIVYLRSKQFIWKREAMLILVYICLIVVARFTLHPFSAVNGKVQPLVFDAANAFPFRVNWVPIVHLFDYPEKREALLNLIGNTAMFVPIGIIWPIVYNKLDTHIKVIAAGVGLSLSIELIQLPFYDRVTDIDDLILNSLGFIAGYGIWLLCRAIRRFRGSGDRSVHSH